MTRQHCTATTKKGNPCRNWAVHNSSPPRCSAHGGGERTVGAPEGNTNAQTHGAYAEQQQDVDLSVRINDLDRRIGNLSQYIDNHIELEPDEYRALLALYGQLCSRLGRLMRDRQQLTDEYTDELDQAMNEALDILSKDLGIKL